MNSTVAKNKAFLVANSKAGGGASPPEIFDEFETLEIDDLAASIFESPDRIIIAVWGGDGTCRTVAQHIVNTDVALLPAPGGTFSHFAKQAGFATIADVESGVRGNNTRKVDAAFVNEEVFLNTASIGWYVDLLTRRQRYEHHLPRKAAKLLSAAVQLFRTRRVRLQLDGVEERVWMLWVGNGIYSTESGGLPQRKALDDGVLDVRILRSGTRLPKFGALLAMLRKNTASSSLVEIRQVRSCHVTLRHNHVKVALDGELVTMTAPLEFQCQPKSLLLVAPS
jgi:diacylglycerol kinase family enzyme